ncbi:hypothetical protein [Hyperthermus butylicus]|uniref:hypothetical protein n=1 Tax=Hyperthermus butylicus TaxID=54248 RepID=UPI00064ED91D|nr:hypothetical protein [Hyperthermus butylicus]
MISQLYPPYMPLPCWPPALLAPPYPYPYDPAALLYAASCMLVAPYYYAAVIEAYRAVIDAWRRALETLAAGLGQRQG